MVNSLTYFLMKRKAFTLIELLIVIAIIGVLAAALYPTIRGAVASGRDAAREGDINNIITGLEVYNTTYGTYPDGTGCISTIFVEPGTTNSVEKDIFKGEGAPKDPSPTRTLPGGINDPGGCVGAGDYYYNYVNANGIEYLIATIMENDTKNNTTDDPTSYDGSAPLVDGETYYIKLI
jgi:prepilin-type N-terminal cleavage/methylation domain-containing protein